MDLKLVVFNIPLHSQQLRQIPGDIDITPVKPVSSLRGQENHRVSTQLRCLDENYRYIISKTEPSGRFMLSQFRRLIVSHLRLDVLNATNHVRGHIPGMNRVRNNAFFAMFSGNELTES
jgi:hypothetical protein